MTGLSEKQYKRLFYYALQLPVMLGDSLTILRGKKLDFEERYRLTLLCAFTPLLDDWFDEERIDVGVITHRIFYPSLFIPENIKDNLAKELLVALHKATPDNLGWEKVAEKLLNAQDLRRSLSADAVNSTKVMGGYSVLLARLMLSPYPDDQEKEAIYQLGFGVQLLDDIFDVYEDSQEQLKTIPVICSDIVSLKKDYLETMHALGKVYHKLPFKKNNVNKFLAFWWSFFARALVSLEQLEEVQNRHGGKFAPEKYVRRELICDMETSRNIYKFVRFYFKYKFF